MKKPHFLWLVLLALVVAACGSGQENATITDLQGEVQVFNSGKSEIEDVQPGQLLFDGYEIRTHPDAVANVQLPNQILLRLDPMSHMVLNSVSGTATRPLEISLAAGNFWLELNNNVVIVNIPGGSIDLEGVEVGISIDLKTNEVAFVCFRGVCQMKSSGISRELNSGDYYVIAIHKDEPIEISQGNDPGKILTQTASSLNIIEPSGDSQDESIVTATIEITEDVAETLTSTPAASSETATASTVPVNTMTSTVQPLSTNTQTAMPTSTFTPTPGNNVFWKIDFETGDYSQLDAIGETLTQANGSHSIVSDIKRAGTYSALLETEEQGTDAAYLFFYQAGANTPLPDRFYLSAWIYLGTGACSADWWNTFQFKSSPDGNSSNSDAVHALNIRNHEVGNCASPLEYQLFSKVPAPEAIHYQSSPRPIPIAQWFHVEVFYARDPSCGEMKVWQDGVKIFDLSCTPTVYPNDTLYVSINNYGEGINNQYYVDDITLSDYRVGP